MSKNANIREYIKWRHKKDILCQTSIVMRDLPDDYEKLKQSLKSKIWWLEKKNKDEKNKIRKVAMEEVIDMYKSILGE